MLKDDIDTLMKVYEEIGPILNHNEQLFNIYEGNLLPYLLEDLKRQLGEQTYAASKHRVPPINVLIRLIDKLSKIYLEQPDRQIIEGAEEDQQSFQDLLELIDINVSMSHANEFFNLFKNTFVEPYLCDGVPSIRALPSDRFFVYSNDPIEPMEPTHFVKIMGDYIIGPMKEKRTVFFAYTDDEFLIFDSKKEIRQELMDQYNNPSGINFYGTIPGVYINRSLYNLIPPPDTDTLSMTKLIPILLSDANFASMYQSFSIIYGIDVDDENLSMSPNAFWRFKSDPNRETKPQIGVIKPDADTDKILTLVQAQMSLWLETRNIKPGTIGSANAKNVSSGIAKLIDESDTSEDRQRQIPYFIKAEKELYDLIINNMHPVWSQDPEYVFKDKFNQGLEFEITFPKQTPLVNPSTIVDDEVKKLTAGISSKKLSISKIEPDMSEQQIDELLKEIAAQWIQPVIPAPNVPLPQPPQDMTTKATTTAAVVTSAGTNSPEVTKTTQSGY